MFNTAFTLTIQLCAKDYTLQFRGLCN